jgi:cation transport regulator
MPYHFPANLPENVKNVLPEHAQHIYLAAFNHAWSEYKDPDTRWENSSREETAHRVAWAAVKNEYQKDAHSGKWRKK